MNAFTIFMVFCVVWWMIWFMLLPLGVVRDDSPHPLHDAGAPKEIKLKRKFFITTLLSVALTGCILYVITHYSVL